MKKLLLFLLLSTFLTTNAQDKKGLNVYWKYGLNAESSDKSFKLKLGGRIQYDVMLINQDDTLNNYFHAFNGSEFRRARLYMAGTIYSNIKYKFQVDFAPGKVVLKDVYLQLIKIPVVGNIRIGHFKEPFGMEMMTSSNFITFMERPLANQFDFDRALGIMIYNHEFNNRFTWAGGYFHPDHNLGIYIGKEYNLTFRMFGVPVYKTKEKYRIVHVGVGYSYQFYNDNPKSYKTRPESHLAPKYISLVFDKLDNTSSFKGELAFVLGPFSFEGEYTYLGLKLPQISTYQNTNYNMYAYFVNLSFFLTGEHKNYNVKKGAFDRLLPKNNFGKGGAGAFEIGVRYSSIDLNDKDMLGGKMGNLTAGLNWYLNPSTRFMFNYILSDAQPVIEGKSVKGYANIYQMRFQITF
jgi:phosphate-selective porin OprO/OprP